MGSDTEHGAGAVKKASMGMIFVLALCLAALVVACGAGGREEGGEGTPTAGPVEIRLWHSEVASNLNTIQDLVRRYNSSQNEVRVKLAYQGNSDENMAKGVGLPARWRAAHHRLSG